MDEVRKVLIVALHANVQPQLTMRGMWDNRCSQASVASNGTHRFKVTIPDKSSLNATQFVSELAAPLHQLGYVLTLLYCYKDILFVGVMNRNKSQNEGGRNKAQKRKYQEDPVDARNGKRQKEIESKKAKKQEKEEKEDVKKQTVEGGWAQAALEMVDVLAALRGKFTPGFGDDDTVVPKTSPRRDPLGTRDSAATSPIPRVRPICQAVSQWQ